MRNLIISDENNLLNKKNDLINHNDLSNSRIKNKKLLKLEAIRGFTAIYVVLGHVFPKINTTYKYNYSILFKFGQESVILFFLLSGFVIHYSHSKTEDKSFKSFFYKRLLRIYIPLFCIFITNFLILSIENKGFVFINTWDLVGNILMLQDTAGLKPNVICDSFLGNTPLWSLSYEWWFYMIFFAATKYIELDTSKIIYSVSIIAAITYIPYPNFVNRELMYLAIWWVGTDLSSLYIHSKKITFKALSFQFFVLILIILILALNIIVNRNPAATIGISPFLELRHFFFAAVAVASAIIWQKFHWIAFNKTIGIFQFIAPISFGIYISHWFLVVNATYLPLVFTNLYYKFATYGLVCVLYSYLVEKIIYIPAYKLIMSKIQNK